MIAWPLPVQDDQVTFGEDSRELDVLARKLLRHQFKFGDQGFLATFDVQMVLDVGISCIAIDHFPRATLVERQVVENREGPLVAFESIHR